MKAVFFIVLLAIIALAAASKEHFKRFEKIAAEVNADCTSTWTAHADPALLDQDMISIRNRLGDLSAGSASSLPEKTSGWSTPTSALPQQFMVWDNWPECASTMQTVHDQSACGSCWAVSVAAAAGERQCIKTGKSAFLAARELMGCCDACGYGCQGGWPSAAWDYIRSSGLPSGSPDNKNTTLCVRYPFQSCMHHTEGSPQCSDFDYSTPSCQKSCDSDSTYSTPYSSDKVKFSSAYSVTGEQNMMKELYENGPLSLSYTVYEDFMTYKSGVYKHKSGSRLGGHAVVLSGWGVDTDGTKYWVVKNNWNNKWAEQGYFRIVRGSNDCGIEAGANAGK